MSSYTPESLFWGKGDARAHLGCVQKVPAHDEGESGPDSRSHRSRSQPTGLPDCAFKDMSVSRRHQ